MTEPYLLIVMSKIIVGLIIALPVGLFVAIVLGRRRS